MKPHTKGQEQPPEFDQDQPSEPATPPGTRSHDDEPPRFDEGGRKPAPVERTGDDGVRSVEPAASASGEKRHRDERNTTDATMPPGEGRDPKRNTM